MDEDLLANIPPEVLAELMGLSSMEDEQALLAQQLARAQALRQGRNQQYRNPAASGVQALGNLVRGGVGLAQEGGLQAKQKGLVDEELRLNQLLAEHLRKGRVPLEYSDVPEVEEGMPISPTKKRTRPVLGALEGY